METYFEVTDSETEGIMLRSQTLHLLPAICISVLVANYPSTVRPLAVGLEASDQTQS
jgi:hypothetical protein